MNPTSNTYLCWFYVKLSDIEIEIRSSLKLQLSIQTHLEHGLCPPLQYRPKMGVPHLGSHPPPYGYRPATAQGPKREVVRVEGSEGRELGGRDGGAALPQSANPPPPTTQVLPYRVAAASSNLTTGKQGGGQGVRGVGRRVLLLHPFSCIFFSFSFSLFL